MQKLFDQKIPLWRRDNSYLRYMCDVEAKEVGAAHMQGKKALFAEVKKRVGMDFDPAIFKNRGQCERSLFFQTSQIHHDDVYSRLFLDA